MAQKFKVGQMVEDFQRGVGEIVFINNNPEETYPVDVVCDGVTKCYTLGGKYALSERTASLRLTGRPFNIGDRVVIGGEKGVITEVYPFNRDVGPTPVRVDMGVDNVWITKDGRAWPGTPIICEHDWQEEETVAEKAENGINALGEAVESCGVYGKELQRVAEIQEQEAIADKKEEVNKELDEAVKSSQAFYEYNNQETENHAAAEIVYSLLKEQHNHARMALKLTGFDVDKEAAALITETVKKVLELGGEFSIKTACDIKARVNQMYDETT